MDNTVELISAIAGDFQLAIPAQADQGKLRQILSVYINELINTDFNRLLNMLYRFDINENKLKKMLANESGKDAGNIIADLIIERELQKIASRKQFRENRADADDEERW